MGKQEAEPVSGLWGPLRALSEVLASARHRTSVVWKLNHDAMKSSCPQQWPLSPGSLHETEELGPCAELLQQA